MKTNNTINFSTCIQRVIFFKIHAHSRKHCMCYVQSVKLPISQNWQAYCPVCEMGNASENCLLHESTASTKI